MSFLEKAGGEPLPAHLAKLITPEDMSQGIIPGAEDQGGLPLIYLLQTGSPPCLQRTDTYMEGATAGRFLLSGADNPIRDTIDIVLALMVSSWINFAAGRGGFLGRYLHKPAGARMYLDEGRRPIWTLEDGSVLQQTRECYGIVDGLPYM
jgi:hypothetical protein